ncbi:MAG: zinc-binding dehydrogenase [Mucilaginibacter sp.]
MFENILRTLQLLENGAVRIAIDSTFRLADARKALERAAQGSIQGKIVLTVTWLCHNDQ